MNKRKLYLWIIGIAILLAFTGILSWLIYSGRLGTFAMGGTPGGANGTIKGTVYCQDAKCSINNVKVYAQNVSATMSVPASLGTVASGSRQRTYSVSVPISQTWRVFAYHPCGTGGYAGKCATNEITGIKLSTAGQVITGKNLTLIAKEGRLKINVKQAFPTNANGTCPAGSTLQKDATKSACYADLTFGTAKPFDVAIDGSTISNIGGPTFDYAVYPAGKVAYIQTGKVGTCTLRTSQVTVPGCDGTPQKVFYDCTSRQ